jgi:hypothetical protein
MKTGFRILACAGVLTAFAVAASAADIDGILIDKMCSTKAISGGQKAATAHDRDCALTEGCQKSGYGVYTTEGKYLTFDDAGNTRAIAALKASKKKDDLKVRVTGDVDGDHIKVSKVKLM